MRLFGGWSSRHSPLAGEPSATAAPAATRSSFRSDRWQCDSSAVTPHREVRLMRQRGQKRDQTLRDRRSHLSKVDASVLSPPLRSKGLRQRPGHNARARGKLRQPDVVVIAPRVVGLWHAARLAAHCPDPSPLVGATGCSESDNSHCHSVLSPDRRQRCRRTMFIQSV